ncbi:hypothetical protein BT93_G0368 [Corymbia citriodora subsp. variegata]|nr:hypothetical protein BT93_G0368 [Corymbia citriodora subsp. variegata]KAF8019656.1 hypothetical protein BT93_G0368 [Corymbia citriodora subsp. variegata]KAF8019657.1 hypothetical protein BT93_G0368 [Corymbia citriodora subsp. variegata]KAF8019658.1 hypothetical protein BT93_G0368 [Corymbia citriodora subsp. variegata]
MDANGVKQPLLSKPLDSPQTYKKELQRRRFRRCKSAPLAEAIPQEANLNGSIQRSESILGNLHPSFKRIAIILAFYLGIGTMCFYLVRKDIDGEKTNNLLDAVYFCIVTMTTVGYGDLVPGSVLTKLLACAFVFSGMAIVGLILSKAADYLVEKQEILLVKALHLHNKVGPTEMLKEIEANQVRYKCVTTFIILLLLIVAGTTFLALVENLDFVDAFYCVCSTITTLGYGDKSFSTEGGRAFAVFWILTSTICLAQFFLYIAELNTENRRRALAKWVLSRRLTNVDLEAADLDNDGVVGAAEFIIYKLKEMGKISQEDISLILEEFNDLDVDQSGTLSVSDITIAQSS